MAPNPCNFVAHFSTQFIFMMNKTTETTIANAVNLFIIDESGSMASVTESTRETFIGLLEKIKQEQTDMPELQQFVNLWTFADNRFSERLIFQEVQRWNGQAPDYRPMGGTPLNDAIGNALKKLENYLFVKNLPTENTRVSVFILTDGEENSSREWTTAGIRQYIGECETKGWEFTYYGTDHDVWRAAEALNIKNHGYYSKNAAGMRDMVNEYNREEFDKKMAYLQKFRKPNP